MSASSRLAIATRGFRGGVGGVSISETIYIDQLLTTAVDYQSLAVDIESVQAIGLDFGHIEVDVQSVQAIGVDFGSVDIDVEIEGCY